MKKKVGARNYALKFYKSKAWKERSVTYRKQHPLCERCLAKGIYTPAALVHHKIHIDENNMNDPFILLSDENLEALCHDCHNDEHSGRVEKARRFNPDGSLIL